MATGKRSNDTFGALRVGNPNEIPINLFCELCKLLMVHPIQLMCCGTRLCRWCSDRGLPDVKPFTCSFCHTVQEKKEALNDKGAGRELNTTSIRCYKCSWKGLYNDYIRHLEENHADLQCPNCNQRFSTVNTYQQHLQEICEYRYVTCDLPGCTDVIKCSEIKSHYLSLKHQELILQLVRQLNIWKKNRSNSLNFPVADIISEQELLVANQSLDQVEPLLKNAFDDCARLRTEHDDSKTKYENLLQALIEIGKSIETDSEKLKKYLDAQAETEKQPDEVKNLQLSINTSVLDMNSTITFRFILQANEMNQQFSMYSPVFRTSEYGYKMKLHLRSTSFPADDFKEYLSVYIILLKGEFDPILRYPFSYNIFVTLLDQSEQKKHIKRRFKADGNPLTFGRPTSEKNKEVGLDKFCPLTSLKNGNNTYLKDFFFFVRVFVDFLNADATEGT